MSLIEVILSIAVAGFVLASAVSLMVSISSIWSERSERHFFADHVDGVTEFLNATFTASRVESGSNIPGPINNRNNEESLQPIDPNGQTDENPDSPANDDGFLQSSDEPIRWARPPGFANYRKPLINFSMTDAPPLLVGLEDAPSLGINAFLHFEADEGLSLLWHSRLQEKVEDTNDLRRTLISPLVTKITYIYWDERLESWEEENEPLEGDGQDQYILPHFMKLFFEYKDETKERMLTIPVPIKSALIF